MNKKVILATITAFVLFLFASIQGVKMIKKVPLATCKTCLSDYQILIRVKPIKISESIAGITKNSVTDQTEDKPYYYYNCYYCDKTSAPAPTVQEAAFKWNELNQ